MADTKLIADGDAITIWWALPNAFANPAKPTPTEMDNAIDVTEAVAWDSYSFGSQASNQTSDPGIHDVGNVQTRGAAQFGGTIAFFYPDDYDVDSTDVSYLAFDALREQWTEGYLIVRADGQKTTTGEPDADKGIVANDFVNIYHVTSDGWDDTVEGDVNYKYAISFLAQSDVYVNAMVATSVTQVTPVAIGSADYTVGGKTPLGTYRTGRQLAAVSGYWNGTPGWARWSSSDSSVATVDANGVVVGVAAGSATIVATDKITNVASTGLSITIV